jgi:putative ABC transport system permease protein
VESALTTISVQGLALAMLPTLAVIGLMFYWSADAKGAIYASARMLIQLFLIGYVLVYIFETDESPVIIMVLLFMMIVASWIAIRHVKEQRLMSFRNSLLAISIPGILILALVSQAVIGIDPWFSPRFLVPLAGMIFSGAMTAVTLASERHLSETNRGTGRLEARRIAFQAAMIPITNALFAVGLVSLPGMMTGQILSGISPMIAAKYQIVVMSMLFGVSGLSAAIYLVLRDRNQT